MVKTTQARAYAQSRLRTITGRTAHYFGRQRYLESNPTRKRIGFDKSIVDYVFLHAEKSKKSHIHYKCFYCERFFLRSDCQIDHRVDWAQHSKIINGRPLDTSSTYDVWIACNDPDNLIVACRYCNASKGRRTVTSTWKQQRRLNAAMLKRGRKA